MNLRYLLTAVAAAILCAATPSQAAKVKVWQQHTASQYEKAQFKQAVVSSEGTLRLARQLKPLVSVDATHIWDIAEDKQGNLFIATGDDGKLFKVTPDGKISVAYTSEDSQILCLARGADGSLYAGTGPGGHILRLDPKGIVRVLCDTPESYIWCLACDPRTQDLYAGTGPKGRIYRITPDGKASLFYATKQEHILCLGVGTDGTVYAGTDKAGLVYRIDGKGKGFVLYSASQTEVRTLLVTPEGVYAGTSSPTKGRTGSSSVSRYSNSSSSTSTEGPSPVSTKDTKPAKGTEGVAALNGPSASEAREESKNSPAAAPSSAAAGENSLYRIAGDGTVREMFREKAMILCQLRHQGRVFVGTGMQGQLFEIDEASKERSEVARLDHGQILCLCRRQDGSIVLGAGDPAKLYVLQEKYASRGSVVSEVLDAKIVSKWGALRWRAETPAGTTITVAVRSGNVAEPDDTWSEWSAEQTDARQALSSAPAGRFLQYRVTLATEDAALTPALHTLSLRYMTSNQAPEITSLEVPDLDTSDLENPKKLKLKWTATDANEDELTYDLFVRKDGWKQWVQLEEGLEKHEFEWDTTTTPSGVYQVKIVASDRKDNPADEALTAERVSETFVVSHTPPAVTVKVVGMEGDQAIVEATASDPHARLTSASFAVNGKKWVNVFPAEGLFDSKTAKLRFKTEALKPGSYVLVLRVRDAAANTGSGDVVFTVQTRATSK